MGFDTLKPSLTLRTAVTYLPNDGLQFKSKHVIIIIIIVVVVVIIIIIIIIIIGATTLCGFSPSQPSLSKFFYP